MILCAGGEVSNEDGFDVRQVTGESMKAPLRSFQRLLRLTLTLSLLILVGIYEGL